MRPLANGFAELERRQRGAAALRIDETLDDELVDEVATGDARALACAPASGS
jgi:hypothetical protein